MELAPVNSCSFSLTSSPGAVAGGGPVADMIEAFLSSRDGTAELQEIQASARELGDGVSPSNVRH